MLRNHQVYNLQKGVLVSIGQSIAGNFNLTKAPMFHDGSFKVAKEKQICGHFEKKCKRLSSC